MRFNEVEIEEAVGFLHTYIYVREKIEKLNLGIDAGDCIMACSGSIFPETLDYSYDQRIYSLYLTVMQECCKNMSYSIVDFEECKVYDKADLMKEIIMYFSRLGIFEEYLDLTSNEEEKIVVDKVLKAESINGAIQDLDSTDTLTLYEVALTHFYDVECSLIKITCSLKEASIIRPSLDATFFEICCIVNDGEATIYMISTDCHDLYAEVPSKEVLEKLIH